MNLVEVKKILKEKNTYIRKNYHVKEIGIFGSFTKGKQKKNSDIDILVVFDKGCKDFFNYMRLKYWLEELFGHNVDLVIKESIKPRLKEKILNEVEYV